MKIAKREFANKLNRIKGVVPKQSCYRSLMGVLISGGKMMAGDTEIWVSVDLECEGDDEFILPSGAFELINKLPDGEIEFIIGESNVTIKIGKIRNTFGKLETETFPRHPAINVSVRTEVDGDALEASVKRVMYAIADNPGNRMMNCLYMKVCDNVMSLIALDGHQASWDKMNSKGEFEALISKDALAKMISIGIGGKLEIVRSDKEITFLMDGCTVSSMTVQGDYFNVDVFASEMPYHIDVSRRSLEDAIQRAMLVADNKAIAVKFSGREAEISVNGGKGDYLESVELQNDSGADFSMGFNPRFLLNALHSFGSEDVEICIESYRKPAILRCEGDHVAVVLPVLLKGEAG